MCAFNSRLDTVDDRDVKPEDRSIKKNIMTYTQKKKKERMGEGKASQALTWQTIMSFSF